MQIIQVYIVQLISRHLKGSVEKGVRIFTQK